MKIKYLFYLMFTFLIFSTTEAQINPVYKIMRQRGWTPLSDNDKTKLTPEQVIKEFLISMGYNDTIVSNLQKIGIDLLKLNTAAIPWDEKILTANSDCIIVGTVARKEYPLMEKVWFHTIAYVQVEEFFRNDYNLPKSQIPVMIESGPTTLGGYTITMHEDTLSIGEHVLLFLSANGLIRLANDNHINNLYKQLVNDPIIRFKILSKYNLESGKVIRRDRVKNLDDVKDEIYTVLTAIH